MVALVEEQKGWQDQAEMGRHDEVSQRKPKGSHVSWRRHVKVQRSTMKQLLSFKQTWPFMTIASMDALEQDLDFDDSNLDQLPQSTLQNLEQSALSSTQREVAARKQWHYQQTTKPLRLTRPSLPPVTAPAVDTASFNAPKSPESDYGLDDNDDEEVLDLNADTTIFQPQLHQNYVQPLVNSANHLSTEVNATHDAPPRYDQLNHVAPALQLGDTTSVDAHIKKVRIALCLGTLIADKSFAARG